MKVFSEIQKFTQPWILILIAISGGYSVYPIINNWNSIVNQPILKSIPFFIGILVISLVIVFLLKLKLITKIDENGIHYQFLPFHLSPKIVEWNEIDKCFIRKYNAITEYGGWGFRFNFFRNNGMALTTKGNIGLQIILKNEKKILIGTQKKEELERTIIKYKIE